MPRVLVTGGSGFIGRHVCREFRRGGATPVVFDGQPPRERDGVEWIQGDVLDADALHRAVRDSDAVLHLASLLSVSATEQRPRDTLDVALLGTRNVCSAAVPGQRVVFASTSEVYGDARIVPTPETCPPSPKSVYGVAKLAAEQYVRTLVGPEGPYFTILRYFSVYGPGQSPNFVVPRFVSQALRDEPLALYGDGTQVRAFTHVGDVARGTVAALSTAKAAGGTYNVGNPGQPVTIETLARHVLEETASGSPIVKVPFAQSDRTAAREIYRRIPDIGAAARDLGYHPQTSLQEGIRDVVASFRA